MCLAFRRAAPYEPQVLIFLGLGARDASAVNMSFGFLTFLSIGFLAQLVDGALGMAFGVISTTFLLSFGLTPAHASAVIHLAEVFTTGASALSHAMHKNINRRLVIKLGAAGASGAIAGAHVLSNIDGRVMRPLVAAYLFVIGIFILLRAVRAPPPSDAPPAFAVPLGVVGGFLDAIGGGGWGATVTSTLLGSGHPPRLAIGSVNTAEFFVTVAAATTFSVELRSLPIEALLGLALGGVLAAPFGGYLVRVLPARPLMTAVGLLVAGLAGYQVATSMNLI
jgi:uncharacterized protein